MAKKKKVLPERLSIFKILLGLSIVVTGVFFNIFDVGSRDFFGIARLGSWLISMGFLILLIVVLKSITCKERKTEEKEYYISMKASQMTMVVVIVGSFILMVLDGINPIPIPYHLFLSYMVCAILITYVMLYKLMWQMH